MPPHEGLGASCLGALHYPVLALGSRMLEAVNDEFFGCGRITFDVECLKIKISAMLNEHLRILRDSP